MPVEVLVDWLPEDEFTLLLEATVDKLVVGLLRFLRSSARHAALDAERLNVG